MRRFLETFAEMVNVLKAKAQQQRQPGRASKLSIAKINLLISVCHIGAFIAPIFRFTRLA